MSPGDDWRISGLTTIGLHPSLASVYGDDPKCIPGDKDMVTQGLPLGQISGEWNRFVIPKIKNNFSLEARE